MEHILREVRHSFFCLETVIFLLVISVFSMRGLMEISLFSHEKRNLSEKAWTFFIRFTSIPSFPILHSFSVLLVKLNIDM